MTLLIKNNYVVAIVPFAEVMGFVAVSVLLCRLEKQSPCSRAWQNFLMDVWKLFSGREVNLSKCSCCMRCEVSCDAFHPLSITVQSVAAGQSGNFCHSDSL